MKSQSYVPFLPGGILTAPGTAQISQHALPSAKPVLSVKPDGLVMRLEALAGQAAGHVSGSGVVVAPSLSPVSLLLHGP